MIELKSILKKPEVQEPGERKSPEPLSLEARVYEIYSSVILSAFYLVFFILGDPRFPRVQFDLKEKVLLIPSRQELEKARLLPRLYDCPVKSIERMSNEEKARVLKDIRQVQQLFKNGQKWHTEEMR